MDPASSLCRNGKQAGGDRHRSPCFEEDTGRWRARENIKTNVPGLSPYFDKRNNKVYWRYRHPITGKNHGLGSIDQKLAETIAAEANSRLARQQMEQMLQSAGRKLLVIPAVHQPLPFFLNNYEEFNRKDMKTARIKLNTLGNESGPSQGI
ncbi:phage integrase Arm DNA-binding domain-containing protein [Shigella flexneri]|nr:phage integrase Arm DNA-binding domain-containing protein [Shigella flexneri]